ncbi:hypothetical protein FDP41_011307 [Naegleria fowleri]|uniref:Nucleolar GTP-binding protein 2 n=1 Tax=Naegleria fowleri TaxID=5763 RepID=A0A6A5BYK5_NAEFO|nr:uncharacterized protein FDP41_011307 [Naegleria fowleri]KAF0982377.1 hypothetical protein FDP41_011307 [Naegleria fowleri]CAG4711879.1 unnamed protein product [Naegleria fowleri]
MPASSKKVKVPNVLSKNTTKQQRKSNSHSLDQNRKVDKSKIGKGPTQLRSRSTIKRLLMYTSKVKRNEDGEIIKGYVTPKSQQIKKGEMARVAPDRTLFGNTRVIGQQEMSKFRQALEKKIHDPYTILLKRSKVPVSLLQANTKDTSTSSISLASSNSTNNAKPTNIGGETLIPSKDNIHALHQNSTFQIKRQINFQETFGQKAQRKKPTLLFTDLTELSHQVEKKQQEYQPIKDKKQMYVPNEYYYLHKEGTDSHDVSSVLASSGFVRSQLYDPCTQRGTSKRIWSELYKVIDSSDVLLIVLDARDPIGTRCYHIEQYLKKEKPHKHVVFILNKCDLVPTWVTVRWVKILSQEYPCLAFHASVQNPFGKGALIQLLRQYAQVHRDKPSISVGLIGYPNVGKSSVINTLRKKKVCKAAPIPGETKVWQYVALMRRIFLIDCPGVVHTTDNEEQYRLKNQYNTSEQDEHYQYMNRVADNVLKGVVRVETVTPDELIDVIRVILHRMKPEYVQRTYQILTWKDHYDFLTQLAYRSGKINKGGSPDLHTVAKKIVQDWQRGRIPWFIVPPFEDDIDKAEMKSLRKELEDKKKNPLLNHNIKQLFYKLKTDEQLSAVYSKHDLKGIGIIPDDKQEAIMQELAKPSKEQMKKIEKQNAKKKKQLSKEGLNKNDEEDAEQVEEGNDQIQEDDNDDEIVDWDEVYAQFNDKEVMDDDENDDIEDDEDDENDMEERNGSEFIEDEAEEDMDADEEEDEQADEEEENERPVVKPPVDMKPVKVKSLSKLDILNRIKKQRQESSSEKKNVVDAPVPKSDNVYIPKALRNKLKK